MMETLPGYAKPQPVKRPVAPRVFSGLDTGHRSAPTPASFQPRAANDDVRLDPHKDAVLSPWLMILGGAVLAAVVGALLGGAFHI
ncbi:MAG: hypothetical protein JWR59_653 [Brevundimonas sp.]|nr:hypothetical protein [Brevundimonas sp.]